MIRHSRGVLANSHQIVDFPRPITMDHFQMNDLLMPKMRKEIEKGTFYCFLMF
jgi:hypothetical protein